MVGGQEYRMDGQGVGGREIEHQRDVRATVYISCGCARQVIKCIKFRRYLLGGVVCAYCIWMSGYWLGRPFNLNTNSLQAFYWDIYIHSMSTSSSNAYLFLASIRGVPSLRCTYDGRKMLVNLKTSSEPSCRFIGFDPYRSTSKWAHTHVHLSRAPEFFVS